MYSLQRRSTTNVTDRAKGRAKHYTGTKSFTSYAQEYVSSLAMLVGSYNSF